MLYAPIAVYQPTHLGPLSNVLFLVVPLFLLWTLLISFAVVSRSELHVDQLISDLPWIRFQQSPSVSFSLSKQGATWKIPFNYFRCVVINWERTWRIGRKIALTAWCCHNIKAFYFPINMLLIWNSIFPLAYFFELLLMLTLARNHMSWWQFNLVFILFSNLQGH